MPNNENEGKVEITPIAPGVIKLEHIIKCPACGAKIKDEIEFEMAMDDALSGRNNKEESEDEGNEDIREIMREE